MNRIRAVALTVSDRCARGEQMDLSGPALVSALTEAGAEVVDALVVSDDLEPLIAKLNELSIRPDINLIITTGGTGLAPRDNTPEATRTVFEREVPGLAEAMRSASIAINPNAMLSRGVCGVSHNTLIVNLPGSPAGVRECFAVIQPVLAHAIRLIAGYTDHSH
jgi:molybdenum cofactor synthesis domain-containing protein